MGVQPKDLIATLPRMHENFILANPPNSPPSSPNTPSQTPLAPGAQRIPEGGRERSHTDTSTFNYSDSPGSEFPVFSSLPVAASDGASKNSKKKSRGRSGSTKLAEAAELAQSRAQITTLRRGHFVSLNTVPKCGDKSCRRRFKWNDRKRNCCMCGQVFCRKCTKYMRKLSHNADPDPLGTFHNVCQQCYNFQPCSGRYRDLKYEFCQFRDEAKQARNLKAAAEVSMPLPAKPSSKIKLDEIRSEIDRLVKGYENQGVISGIVGTPNWQKSKHWVPDARANTCYHCKKKLSLRKVNCRVCGQVFCRECTKSEIILYCLFKDNSASWAINGKEGGPTTKPHRFETYAICPHCTTELEEIMLSNMCDAPSVSTDFKVVEVQPSCFDQIVELQTELASLQLNIEKKLPLYQQLVDTLGIDDSSPKTVEGDHPLRELAKSQADLSDTFTHMANRSQALKNLSPPSETQSKLLKNIMMSTFNFYQEYMFLFKSAQMRLREMMPIDSLSIIQELVDQQSMERVQMTIRQLLFELLNLEKVRKCHFDFKQCLVDADTSIEDELHPFLEKRGEDLEKHISCLGIFVTESVKECPFIKIEAKLSRNGPSYKMYIRYVALDRTKSLLSNCIRELSAKTREEAFLETKSSLAKAGSHVTKQLKVITDQLSPT